MNLLSCYVHASALPAVARRLSLPPDAADPGYLVHTVLLESLGEHAPPLFHVANTKGPMWHVEAYTDHDAVTLRARAESHGDPASAGAVDWGNAISVPLSVPHTCQFEARVCPIIRKSSDSHGLRKGAEVDAYLARHLAEGQACPDRKTVYREWFEGHVARCEGVSVTACQVATIRRSMLVRRTQGEHRRPRSLDRPDVVITGMVEFANAGSFDALVRRGIGRHRGFGFGMVRVLASLL